VLTTVAATNLALIYLLFVVDHSGSDLAGFLPIMAIGAIPFLLIAGFLAWVIAGARAPATAGHGSQQVVRRLRVISGFGLPIIIICGFWAGLGAAFLGLERGSPAGYALTLYQFTLLAAIFADVVTLVAALRARAGP